MKIKRDDFLAVLAAVKPGLAKRDIIEQADHFIFTGNAVVTYNDYIHISHPFKTDFKCTVDADKLYKVLVGIKEDSIDVGIEKNELKVSTKRTKSGLASFKEGKILDYISDLGLGGKERKWRKLPDDFVKAVFLCMFSVSRDMTHGILTCIRVSGKNVVGSDDLRISWYSLNEEISKELFIPVQSAIELVKFPITEYAVSTVDGVTSWLHFRTGDGVTFSTRTMAGKYPDVEPHFDVEGKKLSLPKELQVGVKYVSVMTEGVIDIDRKIKIDVEKNVITCRGDSSIGWVSRSFETEYDGKEFSFFINPLFLSQVLDKSTKVTVGKQSAKFVSGRFRHVMVLSS